jgi:fumarate hydratase class I
MISITSPFSEKDIRTLKVGDRVLISGTIFTGRDAVHKYLFDGNPCPCDLTDQIIYHCGPVIVENDSGYKVMAAGPTTSIREEKYQSELIRKHKLRGVIGKGGMGAKTLHALQDIGACYFHAVGGAAQVLAERILSVDDVFLKEFGSPEAIWKLSVKDFPVVVTMDSHGNSLHKDIANLSTHQLQKLIGI